MGEWWIKYEGYIESANIRFPEENWMDLKSLHGFKLATYRFHHATPRGIICLLHGMHCASSDVTHIAKRLHQEGFTVIAYDQEGHGKSEGPKGTIVSLEDYAGDAEKFILKAKRYYASATPVFLMGESMGGAICVMVSLKQPEIIKGICLFAPALGVDPNFEPFLQKIVRCLDLCCSGCRLKAMDQSTVSRNPHYPGYFTENPDFFTGKLNARTAAAMLNGLENLQLQLEHVTTPVIAFQGGSDAIVSADQVKEFIKVCKSEDKELVFDQNMYHVVIHEPNFGQILDRCVEWVQRRL